MTRLVVSRAPTRIDLGGGWTDVPPYCDREGGFVCNVAITRYAKVRVGDDGSARVEPTEPEAHLVRAALTRAGVRDAHVVVDSDFPFASGLGGSSAASAALLTALAEWRGRTWNPVDIAEDGRRIEVEELGIAGGRQDHYAATHGGALALTFTTGVAVRRIKLTAAVREDLPARSILIYTGQSRISGDTITAVLGAYERGERRVVMALRRMRELAQDMAGALEHGDLDAVGAALAEHWEHQRSLHSSIPTARIDEIVAQSRRAGALGAKAMGASGGGCVLVLCRSGDTDRVRQQLRDLGTVVDFAVDEDGVCVAGGQG